MDIHNLVIAHHHINLVRALKDYHIRHYLWEIAKVLVPVLITCTVTIAVMRSNENRNKKRWLNDGHIKRKTDLEIEIRKYLLGVKANTFGNYEDLADWYEKRDEEELDFEFAFDFNKNFETLYKYVSEESEENGRNYKKIFALMDEYECYSPKIKNLFDDFKVLYGKIFELKFISATKETFMEEVNKNPEHFDAMINTYLCFQPAVESILKKLTIKKV